MDYDRVNAFVFEVEQYCALVGLSEDVPKA